MKRYRAAVGSRFQVNGVRPNSLNRVRVSRGGTRK